MNKILVVEDEKHISELIVFNLESEGYDVIKAYDGEEAIEIIKNEEMDLVLLDLMLPKLSGIEVCNFIRANKSDVLVIMLTAKSEEIDKIIGLEIGADDYITKPFSVRELIARIKALFRRMERKTSNSKLVYELYGVVLDVDKHSVTSLGKKVDLTFKEFELLRLLFENIGNVLTRDFLLDKIWGYDYFGDTRTVDVHIRHIRKKLGEEIGNKLIETVRGVGYKITQ